MEKIGILNNKIYKNLKEIPGIYAFRNIENNKYYIGLSINLRRRILNHLTKCRQHLKYVLYTAINTDGYDKFELMILEEYNGDLTDKKEIKEKYLDPLEELYIKKYDAYMHGYNSTYGRDNGVIGYKHKADALKKISDASMKMHNDGRYKVYVFIIKTKTLKKYLTITEFEKDMNLTNAIYGIRTITYHNGDYILARTLEELKNKLEKINIHNNHYTIKCTDEMKKDINNGISVKGFCYKYKVSDKTFIKFKKLYKKDYIPYAKPLMN